jgi:hypothetical protein
VAPDPPDLCVQQRLSPVATRRRAPAPSSSITEGCGVGEQHRRGDDMGKLEVAPRVRRRALLCVRRGAVLATCWPCVVVADRPGTAVGIQMETTTRP